MEFAMIATRNFIRRLSDDTKGNDTSGTNYQGPLTGIIFAVFVGLTLLFLTIDCTRILSPLSKYLCARERSNRLSGMNDEIYKEFLLKHECFAGVAASIFPSGAWFMKPGAFEDFLRYMANEHHLLGSLLADRLHPFSRYERATAFLIMHSFIFFLTAAASTGSQNEYLIISIVVISPARILIDKFLYLLLAVPCGRACCPCLHECLNASGHFITALLLIAGLFLCWVSAVLVSETFPSPNHQRLIIWNYLYTVFIVSAGEELMLIYLHFVDVDHCCCFSIMNSMTCGMLAIGVWNKEAAEVIAMKPVGDIEAAHGAGGPPVMKQPPSGQNHTAPTSPITPMIVVSGHTVEMTPQQIAQHHVVAASHPAGANPSPPMVVSEYTVVPANSD